MKPASFLKSTFDKMIGYSGIHALRLLPQRLANAPWAYLPSSFIAVVGNVCRTWPSWLKIIFWQFVLNLFMLLTKENSNEILDMQN